MTDAEFDALHGGRELCPIEQLAYEKEGAARFALLHGHGKASEKARRESWGEKFAAQVANKPTGEGA